MMKTLKRIRHIFLSLTLLFVALGSFASGSIPFINQVASQEQEQEGRSKTDQIMMRPDGGTLEVQGSYENKATEEEITKDNSEGQKSFYRKQESDSLQENSVSKYNFIFYFLYKFKYDNKYAP